MKYKVGDEVLVKAKIITGVRKYFGVEVEDNRFDVCEDNIIHVPDMTAEEAWGIARKLVREYFENEEFGSNYKSSYDLLMKFSPQEAKAKIEVWEAEKEIKVGDEVDICGDKGIVTSFGTDGNSIHVLFSDGIVTSYRKDKCIKKTGRHIDIDGILKQIGGNDDELSGSD